MSLILIIFLFLKLGTILSCVKSFLFLTFYFRLTDLKSDLISFEKSSIRLPDFVGGIESFLQQPDSSSFEKNSGLFSSPFS